MEGKLKLFFCFILVTINFPTLAFEAFVSHPGSRAMGMAGIVGAQANDATAIWYNPAGILHQTAADNDLSIEIARQTRQTTEDQLESHNDLLFLGGFMGNLAIYSEKLTHAKVGFAFLKPQRLKISIENSSNNLSEPENIFIDLDYRQISALFSYRINPRLSLGSTFDTLWVKPECLNSNICVKKPMLGFAPSFALDYHWHLSNRMKLAVSSVWHLRARMEYDNPDSALIGRSVFNSVPGRPDRKNVNFHAQIPAASFIVNTNINFGYSAWEESVRDNPRLARGSNYKNFGIGFEILLPLKTHSLAIRTGYSVNQPGDPLLYSKVSTFAFGFGWSVDRNLFIDFGLQNRQLDIDQRKKSENTQLMSVSLSYQK